MPQAPLFWSMADLAKQLRLDKVNTTSALYAQFEEGVRSAQSAFWRYIGLTRTNTIIAYAAPSGPNGQPANDTQQLKVIAASTELMLVRRVLLAVFKAGFAAGTANLDEWNENPFRTMDAFGAQREMERLDSEISANMTILAGSKQSADERTCSFGTPETDDYKTNGPRLIGETVIDGGVFGGLV